ncbi:hypothetical protein [Streptomyces virginiae]|uniref:hypothetical protein n=1 Tax=Streptomyces virginiae TaxID=1961 RepID=UPI003F50E4FD
MDEGSGSKPEHETSVEDAQAVHALLRGLGYVPVVVFEKRCRNYAFEARGRQMLATLVRLPDGTFLELETLVRMRSCRGRWMTSARFSPSSASARMISRASSDREKNA